MNTLQIKRASALDAAGIVAVLEAVVSERIHSAIDQVWPVEQETRYLESLSRRETFHIAADASGRIVGFQSLDQWSTMFHSMKHVGQVGTFLLPGWRGQGVGRQLWEATEAFARSAEYSKLVIQVRASNLAAQKFYQSVGFRACGRLARQVNIDGDEDDEILMEYFLLSSADSRGSTRIVRT